MTFVVRALLPLPVVAMMLTGCSSTRFVECDLLTPQALPASLASLTLQHEEKSGSEAIRCEWQAAQAPIGPITVKADVKQPVSYPEGATRADSEVETSWSNDDRVQVTHRVPDLGDGGYRYTAIYDDKVTVTIKGFEGFRIIKIEVSAVYTSEENIAALEAAAIEVARKVMVLR